MNVRLLSATASLEHYSKAVESILYTKSTTTKTLTYATFLHNIETFPRDQS